LLVAEAELMEVLLQLSVQVEMVEVLQESMVQAERRL
jgi:hypothetical protein